MSVCQAEQLFNALNPLMKKLLLKCQCHSQLLASLLLQAITLLYPVTAADLKDKNILHSSQLLVVI